MASERKLLANRRNAQRSTGPKTPKGKAAVRYNALKHGLLTQEVVITSGPAPEDPDEFQRLHAALVEDLQPLGCLEEMLVQKIAVASWRLRRVVRVETAEISRRLVDSEPELRSKLVPEAALLAALAPLPVGACHTFERSASGIDHLLGVLADAQIAVLAAGHLTKSVEKQLRAAFGTAPGTVANTCCLYSYMVTDPEKLTKYVAKDFPDGPPSFLPPEQCKRLILDAISQERRRLTSLRARLAEREAAMRQLRLASRAIPAPETAAPLLRYEAALERQLYRALAELERLQRRRHGDFVPPPVNVGLSLG